MPPDAPGGYLPTMRRNGLNAAAFSPVLVLGLTGCGSCLGGPSALDPRAFLSAEAPAVVELVDIAALPQLRKVVEKRFGAILPAEDIVTAQEELQRVLGFDPLTEEGLASAGLPVKGRVAGAVSDDAALWVFPVADATKARATVERLVEARASAEKSSASVAGVQADVYGRSFGDEVVEVAAFAVRDGMGFLGLGPKARAQLEGGLRRPIEASVLKAPAFSRLSERLGATNLLRVIMPNGGEALSGAARRARRMARVRIDPKAIAEVEGAAWSLDVGEDGVGFRGRLELSPKAIKDTQALFGTKQELAAGVRAIDLPNAALYLVLNGESAALLQRLAPDGSPARKRLASFLSDMGMSSDEEVTGELTGQLGIALGLGDLAEVELKQLVGNPLSAAWTSIALGVKNPAVFTEATEAMKAKLSERGFEASSVDVDGKAVTSIHSAGKAEEVLVQSFARPGAVVYANEPAVTQGILGLSPGLDPLKGRGGFHGELRIGRLGRQLRTFRVQSLPLMFRSMVQRGIDALGLLDTLSVTAVPVADGMALDGTLTLAPAPTP